MDRDRELTKPLRSSLKRTGSNSPKKHVTIVEPGEALKECEQPKVQAPEDIRASEF